MCPKTCGRHKRHPIPMMTPRESFAQRTKSERLRRKAESLSASGKNLSQFLRWYHFELRISTVRRFLVCPPTPKLCCVTKTIALHVVVRNLNNQFGPQRFPRQVFTLAPAALAT